MRDVGTTVMFDLRTPAWGTPTNELYRAALDMSAFADGIGVDAITLMEHHGSDDGYLPQPFTMAAAMAAVTENVRFLLGAVLLPLHDPVVVAEQIAVTDLISNGRLNVILGTGYVPSEFAMFRKSLKHRAKLMDSGIDTILRALRGERFEADGRPVYVRPLPVQKPEDILLVGGGVPASAKRAVRYGLGVSPISSDIVDVYLDECHRLGREPRPYIRPGPVPISIARTPNRAGPRSNATPSM
jgi:alkanesulfonate monooxygenase SsuD/methylene tetrahydromethanopterin reductase-like flavin-dependent oxidoreductase (luciferase family)